MINITRNVLRFYLILYIQVFHDYEIWSDLWSNFFGRSPLSR